MLLFGRRWTRGATKLLFLRAKTLDVIGNQSKHSGKEQGRKIRQQRTVEL